MRASLCYPVEASFSLSEHWPIEVDGVTFSLAVDDGRLVSIRAEWRLVDGDKPPALEALAPGQTGMGRIHFELASRDHVDGLLRTIQGLLCLHGTIEIDFERPVLRWIAETEDEKLGIDIVLRSDPPKPDPFKLERLEFGAIARTIAAAPGAASLEVALSFMRRSSRDLKERRYIESFYNSFFFIETQFAAGVSSPANVKRRLKAEPRLADALALARAHPLDIPSGYTTEAELAIWDERVKFISRSNEAIIDELVDLRGRLHHHSLRSPHAWHPDRPMIFRVPAFALRDIVFALADGIFSDLVLSADHDELLADAAERAGAITVFRVDVEGIFPTKAATRLSFELRAPGIIVTRGMVEAVDLSLRERIDQAIKGPMIVNFYTITDAKDGRLYGRYERTTQTP